MRRVIIQDDKEERQVAPHFYLEDWDYSSPAVQFRMPRHLLPANGVVAITLRLGDGVRIPPRSRNCLPRSDPARGRRVVECHKIKAVRLTFALSASHLPLAIAGHGIKGSRRSNRIVESFPEGEEWGRRPKCEFILPVGRN
jgi:hypothetical protein